MSGQGPRYIASGNIRPSRFVQPDTAKNFHVLEIDTADTDQILGVSQDGTRRAPGTGDDDGFCAIDGESLTVFSSGDEALITAGAAVVRGDMLKSDAQGRAVPTTLAEAADTKLWIGGIALESASAAGELIRMIVRPQIVNVV